MLLFCGNALLHFLLSQINHQDRDVRRADAGNARRLPQIARTDLVQLFLRFHPQPLNLVIILDMLQRLDFQTAHLLGLSRLPPDVAFVFDFDLDLFKNLLRQRRPLRVKWRQRRIIQLRAPQQVDQPAAGFHR